MGSRLHSAIGFPSTGGHGVKLLYLVELDNGFLLVLNISQSGQVSLRYSRMCVAAYKFLGACINGDPWVGMAAS